MDRLRYAFSLRGSPYLYCSIVDLFKGNVAKYPDKELFIERGLHGYRRALTNKELDLKASKVAKYLVQKGIKKGDKIAIFGPNTLEWVVSEIGIIMAGAISVHVTINTQDVAMIRELLLNMDCKALILDADEKQDLNQSTDRIIEAVKSIAKETAPLVLLMRKLYRYNEFDTLSDIYKFPNNNIELPTAFPEDTAIGFQTSGSTGSPKIVLHTHFNVTNLKLPTCSGYDIIYNDRPFSWFGGLLTFHLCNNNTRVFADSRLSRQHGNIKEIYEIMQSEKCTQSILLPYFLHNLLLMQPPKQKIQKIITGGEMIDTRLFQLAGKYCYKFTILYGSTEAGIVSFKQIRAGEKVEKGNVGKTAPGVEVKIISEDGYPVTLGITGTIYVRGINMSGVCYQKGNDTIPLFSRDGWLCMADIGSMSKSGDFIIKGRIKNVISRGTNEIIPTDLEEIILKAPGIDKVVVIPVPDERLLEEICVCYISHDGERKEEDVVEFCKQHFFAEESYDGYGEMPKYFLKFDDFPKLSNGKINTNALKEAAKIQLNLQ